MQKRLVYWFIDPIKNIGYVGLTKNLERRFNEHLFDKRKKKSELVSSLNQKNLEFYHTDFMTEQEATFTEEYYIDFLKNKQITLLNKNKAGSLGGNPSNTITKDMCLKDAKKYKTLKEWREKSTSINMTAYKRGWIKECSKHLIKTNKWNKLTCIKSAKNFMYVSDWLKKYPGAYNCAYKNKWIPMCIKHMKSRPRPLKWTLSLCIKEANKYKNKKEWFSKSRKSYNSVYNAVMRNGWQKKLSHIEFSSNIFRTKLDCISAARRFKTRSEWAIKDRASYSYARRHNLVKACVNHMKPTVHLLKWNKEECIKNAKKYQIKSAWIQSNKSAYNSAYKNGWINECISHMIIKHKTYKPYQKSNNMIIKQYNRLLLTKEDCITQSLKYNNPADWKRTDYKTWRKAYRLNILEECYKHMMGIPRKLTDENIFSISLKYKTKISWIKSDPSSYNTALKRNIIEKATEHMKKNRIVWNKELALNESLKYNKLSDFRKQNIKAYKYIWKHGLFDRICSHMK